MLNDFVDSFHQLYERLRKKETELWLAYQREDPDSRKEIARRLEAIKDAEHHLLQAVFRLREETDCS
jgi:hypothetical protein